jgi:hypothetical protein
VSALLELAARCETVAGPNYQLECELFECVGKHLHGIVHPVPNYTVSIDAAALLVSDGCGWLVAYGRTRDDEPLGGAEIVANGVSLDGPQDKLAEAEAATPALALCAAALRARATGEQP